MVISQVKEYARIWSRYANIFFDFIDGPFNNGQIRIAFKDGPGHYSYVGDPAGVHSSLPTMNFDSRDINANTLPHRFRRIVLHEFGHALGCAHEHSRPDIPINWDKPKLYEYYRTYLEWDQGMVDLNIIGRYKIWSNLISSENVDKNSIMQYELGSDFTTDSELFYARTNLSLGDKRFVERCYPVTPGNAGAFTIEATRIPEQSNAPTLCSLPPDIIQKMLTNRDPREILFGVTRVTSNQDFDLRSDFDTPHIHPDPRHVRSSLLEPALHIHAPRNDNTYRGSWLTVTNPGPDIQFGYLTVTVQDPTNPIKWNQTRAQDFPHPYPSHQALIVLVWFHSIESLRSENHQLFGESHMFGVAATNITNTSFDLLSYGFPYCKLGVTWLSYPAARDDIFSGSFSFEDKEGRKEAWEMPFEVTLDSPVSRKPTKVFAAFSRIATLGGETRVSVDFPEDTIERTKVTLNILPSVDTRLCKAAVTYIVIAP